MAASLLTAAGQPCPEAIKRAAELSLFTRYAGRPDLQAQAMETTLDLYRGVALAQAKRFGKTPTQVEIIDLQEERLHLWASYGNRDQHDARYIEIDARLAFLNGQEARRAELRRMAA